MRVCVCVCDYGLVVGMMSCIRLEDFFSFLCFLPVYVTDWMWHACVCAVSSCNCCCESHLSYHFCEMLIILKLFCCFQMVFSVKWWHSLSITENISISKNAFRSTFKIKVLVLTFFLQKMFICCCNLCICMQIIAIQIWQQKFALQLKCQGTSFLQSYYVQLCGKYNSDEGTFIFIFHSYVT